MFTTAVILPDNSSYVEEQSQPFSEDYVTAMKALEELDQSKFDKVVKLPMTLPEMLIGEYLLANTQYFETVALSLSGSLEKRRVVIDDRMMENMYMTIRMHRLPLSSINRVYVAIITTVPEITVHVTRVDYEYDIALNPPNIN